MRWYFDFISPYAYLQFKRLQSLGLIDDCERIPVLFAGVLNHLGQRGPAEIPGKREFTYRQVCWLARRQGVPFRLPAAHPFNPLKLLRLALHQSVGSAVVARLFDFVWREGCVPEDATAFAGLLREFGIAAAGELERADLKSQLRLNTEQAIAAGVFGVPTLAIGTHLFWGQDATDMALEFRRDPQSFAADDERIAALPAAAARRGAAP